MYVHSICRIILLWGTYVVGRVFDLAMIAEQEKSNKKRMECGKKRETLFVFGLKLEIVSEGKSLTKTMYMYVRICHKVTKNRNSRYF